MFHKEHLGDDTCPLHCILYRVHVSDTPFPTSFLGAQPSGGNSWPRVLVCSNVGIEAPQMIKAELALALLAAGEASHGGTLESGRARRALGTANG